MRFQSSAFVQPNNFVLKQSVEDTTILDVSDVSNKSVVSNIQSSLKVLYKFSRPHTIKVIEYLKSSSKFQGEFKLKLDAYSGYNTCLVDGSY